MIVRYLYSACIVIETNDLKICCDPWFTQRIYDGSWFQYPEIENPIDQIGEIDYVYVSHIHRDHYDPPFLNELMKANPDCELLIGNENQDFLREKMKRESFSPRCIDRLRVGSTELAIIPNYEDSEINIDSALVVKGDGRIVVNLNDCPYDPGQIQQILEFCGRAPDLACLPYAGAGPYPQAYRFKSDTERSAATAAKKERFLELFKAYFDALEPRLAMPFAGVYYLGGSLRRMNHHRGIPDAVEVRQRFGERVIVLVEGNGLVDLASGQMSGVRTEPYDTTEIDAALSKYDTEPLPYELDEIPDEDWLVELLGKAHLNATSRIHDYPEMSICIKCPETRFMWVNAKEPGIVRLADFAEDIGPREEFHLDSRLLSGLLTRRYHWHSAEAGSHFEFYREPDAYDRRIYNLLNFLHI